MADRLRLVSLRWPRPPVVHVDFSPAGGAGLLRDSFAIALGDLATSLTASTTRWGGERVVAERRTNATISFDLMAIGATPDASLGIVSSVLENALSANNPDLAVEWRPDGATYSEYWRIRGAAKFGPSYSWAKFRANYFPVTIAIPVAPTAEGGPYDIFDDFGVDTMALGDWIKDAGTNSVSILGGVLKPSAGGGAVAARYRHARGYLYGDVELAMNVHVSSTAPTFRLCLAVDPTGLTETYLALELNATGSALVKVVNGVRTSLSTTGSIGVVGSIDVFMQLRRAGNVLYWRCSTAKTYADYTVEPNTYQLTAADLRLARPGHVGFSVTAFDTFESYDEFAARAFVYRDIRSPEVIRMVGPIAGDAPAIADIEVTPVVGVSTSPAIFGLVAWGERAKPCNRIGVGNLTTIRPSGTPTYGWGVSAVSGVIGAASSYARGVAGLAPRWGGSSLQINTPATADTGGNYLVSRRFKRGQVYAFLAWVCSTSGTPNARVKFGVSGDLSVGPTTSMGSLQLPLASVWQPTADYDSAYVTIGNVTATIALLEASGMVLVESPPMTLSASLTSSQTTMAPWYVPSDLPLNADGSVGEPFRVLVDQEIMLVQAISTAGVWTVIRGYDGSTGAAHSADAYVILLPTSQAQYEGKGAAPIFGLIQGEDYAQDRQAATIVSSTDYLGGSYAKLTVSGTFLDYYVDPSSLPPDDFQQGETLVEVWARLAFDPAATGVTVQVSVNASETYDPTVALASTAGVARTPFEPAMNPLAILPPSGSGGTLYPQFYKLGTISVQNAKQRLKLRLGWTCTAPGAGMGIDYVIVVPPRNRAATPTGDATADPTYPCFMPPTITALAVTKILKADGSGALRVPRLGAYTQPEPFPDAGLGYSIDLPNVDCDLLVKLSNLVPNDPTVQGAEMFTAEPFWRNMVHVPVTPRFTTVRPL